MIFGRTDLVIGQFKAKFCEESVGNVRFRVAPQKPGKNMEKRMFETKKIGEKKKLTSKNEMWGIV